MFKRLMKCYCAFIRQLIAHYSQLLYIVPFQKPNTLYLLNDISIYMAALYRNKMIKNGYKIGIEVFDKKRLGCCAPLV